MLGSEIEFAANQEQRAALYGFGTIRHQARKQGKPKLAPFFFLNSIVVEILIVAEATAARRCWAVGVDIRLRARLRGICIESIPVSADGPSFPDQSNDGRRTIERAQAMRRYCDNEGKFGFIDH
jgi:hypothetical protein